MAREVLELYLETELHPAEHAYLLNNIQQNLDGPKPLATIWYFAETLPRAKALQVYGGVPLSKQDQRLYSPQLLTQAKSQGPIQYHNGIKNWRKLMDTTEGDGVSSCM